MIADCSVSSCKILLLEWEILLFGACQSKAAVFLGKIATEVKWGCKKNDRMLKSSLKVGTMKGRTLCCVVSTAFRNKCRGMSLFMEVLG